MLKELVKLMTQSLTHKSHLSPTTGHWKIHTTNKSEACLEHAKHFNNLSKLGSFGLTGWVNYQCFQVVQYKGCLKSSDLSNGPAMAWIDCFFLITQPKNKIKKNKRQHSCAFMEISRDAIQKIINATDFTDDLWWLGELLPQCIDERWSKWVRACAVLL